MVGRGILNKKQSLVMLMVICITALIGLCPQTKVSAEETESTFYDGIDYSAVYDYEYYKSASPDVYNVYGDDPEALLQHFVEVGMSEGRRGNENFNVASYRNANQDLRLLYGKDWKAYYMHYVNYGFEEGRIAAGVNTIQNPVTIYEGVDYSPVYDYDYYKEASKDVYKVYGEDDAALLEHFVEVGMGEGRRGNEEFNVTAYRNANQDLRLAFGNDLEQYYLHYIYFGQAEGRTAMGVDTLQDPATVLDGVDYSAVYDYDYYINHHPDIYEAYAGDDVAALEHFVNYGIFEGRQGNDTFNVQSYKYAYQDLRVAFRDDLEDYYMHYIYNGQEEGRIATGTSTLQNPVTIIGGIDYADVYDYDYYINRYSDLKEAFGDDDIAALQHFAYTGMREGRVGKESYDGDRYADLRDQADPMTTRAQQYESETDYLLMVDCTSHQVGIYEGEKGQWELIDSFPCGDGAAATPTPLGEYEITRKFTYFDDGNARLWYASAFITSEYLFHSVLYYQEPSPETIMDGTLGQAVSHGCVRLSLDKAEWIFDNVPVGSKVVTYR